MSTEAMESSITYAKKYLEDLLSFFGLNTNVMATRDDEVIELSVPSTHLNGFLIGQRGETLRSLQFMVGMSLRNNNFEYTRVNIDVADYKRQRSDRLAAEVEEWAKQVRDSGEERALAPMSAVDRRTVHKTVGEISGVVTESAGEGRDRHVLIKPAKKED